MKQVAPPADGDDYVTLLYNVSETRLSNINKKKLKDLVFQREKDQREEIRILVWADQEYDSRGQNALNVSLAKERAWKIKDYIYQRVPQVTNIVVFNMARAPHLIDRLFQTKEFDIKSEFEKSEITATVLPDGRVSYTKASKALVIIKEKENI